MVGRGEVWWAEHEEHGRRPFLVLTRESAIPVLHRVICVPVTRTIREIPTEVRITVDDGMPTECALSVDNVTLVPRAVLTERICRLRGEKMAEVCRALAIATGCT